MAINIYELNNQHLPVFQDGGIVSGQTGNTDHGGEFVAPLSVLKKIEVISEFLGKQRPISSQVGIMSGKGSYAEHLRNQE
jgi:hypothetical protein